MAGSYNLGTAEGIIRINYEGDGAKRAQQDFDKTTQSATKSGEGMRRAGVATAAAGAAIGAALIFAIKKASDFEAQISGIAAVTGASGKDLDLLRNKALQLGRDTVFSASEAAGAMEELAKAGVPLPDILNGAADAAVALAAAGGIDLPQAATIAANAMNAFNIAAKDLPRVADLIAGAANASAIDVSQFGQSLQQVGAVAHLAGITFDDLAVAIAEMGNAGIKGSDAGTSLKTFLQNLIPQTKQQKKLFDELGITTRGLGNKFFDASGKAKSLADISQVLQDATKGMSKEQQLATLQILFGSDAIRAAAVLAQNGSTGFNNLAVAMGKVTAADVAKARMDNLNGSIEQLKGSVETLAIRFGETLQAPLKRVADIVTNFVNVLSGLPSGVLQTVGAVAALAAGFLILVGSLTAIAGTLALIDFGLVFNPVTLVILGVVGGLTLIGIWLQRAWTQSQTFRDTVVGALNAVRDAYNNNLAPALEKLGSIWSNTIQPAVSQLADFIQGRLLVAAESVISAFRDRIGPAISTVSGIIQNQIIPTLQSLAQWWDTNKAAIEPVIGAFIKLAAIFAAAGLVTLIGAVVIAFQTLSLSFQLIVGTIQVVTLIIRQFIQGIQQIGSGIATAASAIGGAFNSAVAAVGTAIQAVVNFFIALPGRILAGIQALPGFLIGFFTSTLNTVAFAVGFALGSIVSFFASLPGRIVGAIASLVSLVVGVFNSARASAIGVVSSLVGSAASIAASLPGRVAGAISGVIGAVGSILSSAASAGRSGISSLVSSVVSTVSSLPGRIASFAGSMFSAGGDMIRGAINGVLSAVGGLVDAARNAASRAVAGFKSALGISSPSKLMRDQVGVPIIQGVILGIDNMRANLRATLGDLALNAIVSPITSQPSFAAVASGAVASGASVVNNTNVTVNAPAPVVDADSIARLTTKRVVSALNTNTSGASR